MRHSVHLHGPSRRPRPILAGVAGLCAAAISACAAMGLAFQEQAPPPTQPASPPAPAPPKATPGSEQREAIILLRDGQRYRGILVEEAAERIVLKIAGIDTPIPRYQIDRVTVLPPVREQYRSMRATIANDDAEGLLLLIEWLRTREQWDAALTELDHVLKIAPQHPDALRLKLLVESQRRLAASAGKKAPGPDEKEGEGAREFHASPDPRRPAFPLLTPADINLIKVYEVNLRDPPRMTIRRDTIDRLLQQHQGDPLIPRTQEGRDALYRASPARILELMFRAQARPLYGEVAVIDHPRSMRLFRDEVHRTWLVNSCTTTRCHGGAEAGRLRLTNQRPGADDSVYTNFLILERFRLDDGRALINYENPGDSPLLHMGLPREGSLAPHPPVFGRDALADQWRPVFRNTDDRGFVRGVEWIRAMYRPRPEYPIHFTPPAPSEPPPKGEQEPPVER